MCMLCSVACSVEHLCIVVITLIIPTMGCYSSLERGSNLTCSEFQFSLKTREKKNLLSGIFDQRRDIHMVTCCEFVCLCVNIISNRDAYWTVKFKVRTFLCF